MKHRAKRQHTRSTEHNVQQVKATLANVERPLALSQDLKITRAVNELPIPDTNFELLQALRSTIGVNIWRMRPERLHEWRQAFLSRTFDSTERTAFYRAIHPDHRRQAKSDIMSQAHYQSKARRNP